MFQALASGNLPGEDLQNVGKNGQSSGCHVDMFSYEKKPCLAYIMQLTHLTDITFIAVFI